MNEPTPVVPTGISLLDDMLDLLVSSDGVKLEKHDDNDSFEAASRKEMEAIKDEVVTRIKKEPIDENEK